MGFTMHFYIIFGTNLLTQSPVPVSVFLLVSVFRRKGISNGVQTEWNLRESYFWNDIFTRDLSTKAEEIRVPRRVQRSSPPPGRAPHSRGPHVAPPTYFFLLYIPIYPENIREHHETLIPPPQPSVPMRSHLGAFSGILPEGDSITEGFYINTIASPMKRE